MLWNNSLSHKYLFTSHLHSAPIIIPNIGCNVGYLANCWPIIKICVAKLCDALDSVERIHLGYVDEKCRPVSIQVHFEITFWTKSEMKSVFIFITVYMSEINLPIRGNICPLKLIFRRVFFQPYPHPLLEIQIIQMYN